MGLQNLGLLMQDLSINWALQMNNTWTGPWGKASKRSKYLKKLDSWNLMSYDRKFTFITYVNRKHTMKETMKWINIKRMLFHTTIITAITNKPQILLKWKLHYFLGLILSKSTRTRKKKQVRNLRKTQVCMFLPWNRGRYRYLELM